MEAVLRLRLPLLLPRQSYDRAPDEGLSETDQSLAHWALTGVLVKR